MTAARETCPSSEELAAFLDGKLSPEERAWGIEHLAGCESCYALFSEVVRFREESAAQAEAQGEAARPSAPFERRAGWRRWRPAALPWRPVVAAALAAALLAAIGIPVYRYFTVVPELDSAGLLASLHGREGRLKDIWSPSPMRGPDDRKDHGVSIDNESFQLGVRLVDLRLALEADAREQALEVLSRIDVILENGSLPEPELGKLYRQIAERIGSGTSPRALLGEAAALERTASEGVLDSYLRFGKWVEAGRLAAAPPGETRFFTSRETRHFLGTLLRQRGDDSLEPKDARVVADLQASLGKSTVDLNAIGKKLDAIVERFFRAPVT